MSFDGEPFVVPLAIPFAASDGGATRLQRVLGDRGLIAFERLMGMLLVVVAVQMPMTGVARFVQGV